MFRQTEFALLENWRLKLTNANNQSIIKESMAKYGFNDAKLAAGNDLLQNTVNIWDFNKQEDVETAQASNKFKTVKQELHTLFMEHRTKARDLMLIDHPDAVVALKLAGNTPDAYQDWLALVKLFYKGLDNNPPYKETLFEFNISEADLTKAKDLIVSVEHNRSEYLREVGESEDATKQKDAAFATMAKWMKKFDAAARHALADHPQLLEALGIKRKS